jgi:arylsulfatase A-like enzyme
VVFDQAYSVAPWTLPAHASLFTGRWPHELSVGYREPLDEQSQTLAEHFAARGYATAGFVANLGYCSRSTGLARGFGHYEDYPRSLGQVASNSTLLRTVADNFNVRRLISDDEHLNRVTANDINRRFQDWLVTNRDAPFFVFLNYFDAHEPYLPPPPFDRQFGPGRQHGRFSPLHHAQWDPAAASRELDPVALTEEIDAYDGALASLDHQLGVLLDDLSARGLLDRTLVIITSDHGEEFAEHRVLEHGYSLYRAALQVPLLMILPGVVPEALRIPTPVSLRDVAATVVELTGGTASTIGGTSLSRFWLGDDESGSPVVSELSRPPGNLPEWYPVNKGYMRSLVHRGFRYIRNGDLTEELYALEADPWERLNLAADPRYADILREASTRLDEAGGAVR